MFPCCQCDRSFNSIHALDSHCRAKADHYGFSCCGRIFAREEHLQQHRQNSSNHLEESDDSSSSSEDEDVEPYCAICKRWFGSVESLYQHLASPRHNWCFVCSRDFASESSLEQHHASPVHRARDLQCPLCRKGFKAPSSIALHIESGACHNISRHQVTAAIHSLPIVPTISLSHRIEGGSSPARRTITSYSATELAFNGTAYECYLCHRTFRTLTGLNAHLDSPAHDEDEFKCPKCRVTFKLVSGMIQHVESEVCGLARFEQVQDQARALTDQFTRLLRL